MNDYANAFDNITPAFNADSSNREVRRLFSIASIGMASIEEARDDLALAYQYFSFAYELESDEYEDALSILVIESSQKNTEKAIEMGDFKTATTHLKWLYKSYPKNPEILQLKRDYSERFEDELKEIQKKIHFKKSVTQKILNYNPIRALTFLNKDRETFLFNEELNPLRTLVASRIQELIPFPYQKCVTNKINRS